MKKKLSASHLLLYICLFVYLAVAVIGLVSAGYMILISEYSYALEMYIGLFGFSGVCGSCTIGFYCNKAKKENEILLENSKYEKRLELARDICAGTKDGEIDGNAFRLLRVLISDDNTAISADEINEEGG